MASTLLFYFLGAVIVFTALMSVTFLNRVINKQMWLGILFVVLGLLVIGVADFVQPAGKSVSYLPLYSEPSIWVDHTASDLLLLIQSDKIIRLQNF